MTLFFGVEKGVNQPVIRILAENSEPPQSSVTLTTTCLFPRPWRRSDHQFLRPIREPDLPWLFSHSIHHMFFLESHQRLRWTPIRQGITEEMEASASAPRYRWAGSL